jgi:hypothetical protein
MSPFPQLTKTNISTKLREALSNNAPGLLALWARDEAQMIQTEIQHVERGNARRERLVVPPVVRLEGREDSA